MGAVHTARNDYICRIVLVSRPLACVLAGTLRVPVLAYDACSRPRTFRVYGVFSKIRNSVEHDRVEA
jgi:hypothetical protein